MAYCEYCDEELEYMHDNRYICPKCNRTFYIDDDEIIDEDDEPLDDEDCTYEDEFPDEFYDSL